MKIPWNLELPLKTLQSRLNKRLTHFLKPLVYSMIFFGIFFMVCLQIHILIPKASKNPD